MSTYSHGHAARGKLTPTYRTWRYMKERCRNKKNIRYSYMNANIEVCDRWKNYENFLLDMGERPYPNASLDRIDNEKGYCKENCRWATQKEQQNNRTNNVAPIEFRGVTKTLPDWAVDIGMTYKALWCRIHTYKWSIERALTQGTKYDATSTRN